MLFEFTLAELLMMECPGEELACPICFGKIALGATHTRRCPLGKAIRAAARREARKGKKEKKVNEKHNG